MTNSYIILAANGSVTSVTDIKTKDTTSTITTTTDSNKAFICAASFHLGGSTINAINFATLAVSKGNFYHNLMGGESFFINGGCSIAQGFIW